jgi:hypothetical protein
LYFDQSSGDSPISSTRTNNADVLLGTNNATYDHEKDSADFSSINSGNYYFSWSSWEMQEAEARDPSYGGWKSEAINTNRQANSEYNAYINDPNTGVGIVFTNLFNSGIVGVNEGFSSSLYYRMQSVNNLTLTGGNDTFATGKVFWNMQSGPSGAFVNYAYGATEGKTFLNSVDAVGGINTFLDNSLSVDIKQLDGSAQSGKFRQEAFLYSDNSGPGGAGQLGLYSYLGTNDNTQGISSTMGLNAAGTPETGHMERVYIFDDSSSAGSVLNIRAIATIDNSYYGTPNLNYYQNNIYNDSDALFNTSVSSTDLGYLGNLNRATYTNFNQVQIDDYGTSPASNAATNPSYDSSGLMMRGNYYMGVRDIMSVASNSNPVSSGSISYKQFDLGGRYFINENDGDMAPELASHISNSSQIRVQWLTINSPKVDTAFVVQDGFDGTSYNNYYGYRNVDYFEIGNANNSQAMEYTFVFNIDFNFNNMSGKEFSININKLKGADDTVHMLFQQQLFNYDVNHVAISSDSSDFIISDKNDPSKTFTIHLFSQPGSTIDFQDSASSVIRNNLSPEQLYNLETYGNIDGIDTTGGAVDSSSNIGSSSDSLSSYGSNTMHSQEETAAKEANFSNGNGGVSAFGRGSRSHDSLQANSNIHDTDSSSSKTEHKSDADTRYELDYGSIYAQKQEDDKSKEDTEEDSHTNTAHADENQNPLDDIHNSNAANNANHEEDTLHTNNGLHNINDLTLNVNLDDFTNDSSAPLLDLNNLFNLAEDLLSNNANLSDSLHEMVQSIQAVNEESINTTNQQDELDSMSFALDSMFNVSGDTHIAADSQDTNIKHKNSNGGHGGNS